MTPVGRDSNYRDPADPFTIDDVDLTDPLERAAIALHRTTFEVAAEVAGHFTGPGEHALAYSWAAQEPTTRRRYRVIADVVVQAHATPRGDSLR